MSQRPGKTVKAQVWTVEGGSARRRRDVLAAEEPLEIRLSAGSQRQSVAITMRTPGADFELAAGFLLGEGVVSSRDEISSIAYCTDPDVDGDQQYNIVTVELRRPDLPDLAALVRHWTVNSACGVCGKASLEALQVRCPAPLPAGPLLAPATILELPARLRAAQAQFDLSGGLHAAALFDPAGRLLALREDVGRHNALDKLFGWALLSGALPLHERIVLVSGRASYELAQKCVAAGAPVLAAISAPSSLAVAVAQSFGMTLLGFVRDQRFNVYAGIERIEDSNQLDKPIL
jgi:FdhD protein